MIHTTWIPAQFSHAKELGTVMFTGDFHQSYGSLTFQDGSLLDHGENGVTNEVVIQAIIDRITAQNQPPYRCVENDQAINLLIRVLAWLDRRTATRIDRGVAGSDTP